MKSNVFIIHGTEGNPNKNWYPWLKNELETKGHNVIVPHFPSPPIVAAIISEWFDVLKDYQEYINEDTIFVGHSLGGIFTLRVMEKLNHSIKAAFFVGTPVGVSPIVFFDRDNSFSGFEFDWDTIKRHSNNFVVYHSDDDPYVGLDNGKELAKHLGVELTIIPKAGHFVLKAGYEKFPELLKAINKII